MNRKLAVVFLSLVSICAAAQTRTINASWTASPSTGVTGYNVYMCTVVSGGTSCTPALTSPVNTSLITGTTFTATGNIGSAYGLSVVAVAPPCTLTSPLGSSCGNSPPATVNYIPVPPQTSPGSNVTVVVQ